LVGLLALSISPMEWLHADGKLIILCPFCHIKSFMDAQVETELYFNFSLVSGTEFGKKWQTCHLATCRRPSTRSGCNNLETVVTTYLLPPATT
jgi:hypothetical protein